MATVWFLRADFRGDEEDRMCCWWIEALLINVCSSVGVRSAMERKCRGEALEDRQRRVGARRRSGGMLWVNGVGVLRIQYHVCEVYLPFSPCESFACSCGESCRVRLIFGDLQAQFLLC